MTTQIDKNSEGPPGTALDTARWMGELGDSLKLNELIMPGSHDAGMAELHHCDIGSAMNKGMVQTQRLNILEQLKAGSRYFDIRVDYDHKELVTYHRSGNAGCNGQTLVAVLDQAVDFLQAYPSESFILKFSHIRTNRGKDGEIKERINGLLNTRKYQEVLYTQSDQAVNLAEITLGNCRGKMILVFDYPQYIEPQIGRFRYHDGFVRDASGQEGGAYRGPNLTVCDSYANTTNLEKMQRDQLGKLDRTGGLGQEFLFLLSWTLTPGVGTFFGGSIKQLAAMANRALPRVLQQQYDAPDKPMPNIVYIDYVNVDTCQSIIQYNFLTQKTI